MVLNITVIVWLFVVIILLLSLSPTRSVVLGLGAAWLSRGHLAMSGGIFGCHKWESAEGAGIYWHLAG